MLIVKINIVFLLIFLSQNAFTQIENDFNGKEDAEITKSVYIYEDITGSLSFNNVRTLKFSQRNDAQVINLGISPSTYWLKLIVKNNSTHNHLLLELLNPLLDQVHFYVVYSNGKVDSLKSGEEIKIVERKYKHQNFFMDINTFKGEAFICFIKVKSGDQMIVPFKLDSVTSIFESAMIQDLIFGLYFGIVIVMFFYNLFIYFMVRDSNYLYYIIYILFVGLTQACLLGYTYRFLWPDSPLLAKQSLFIIGSLGGISVAIFLRAFLRTKEFTPMLDKGLTVFIYGYITAIILSLFKFYNLSYKIIDVIALVGSVYIFSVGFYIYKRGYRPAKFFLLAWSIFLTGICVFVLKDYNVLPYNSFTFHTLQIGSALEIILLSFALADKINMLKKEKEASQQQVLVALQDNNKTLMNLRKTEAHLVNNEKMASLGQLSAGIAHEINNPINYVISNINPLKQNICDIFELLEKYNALSDESDLKEKLSGIQKFKKEMEVDVLVGEIELLLNGIHDGARRTAEIIKGMSTFSRSDESGYKSADLHQCIDSTLVVLNSSIKGKIEVVKEYDNLPMVECNPGKLNQIFLNLLNNAAQAIKSKENVNNKGMIRIQTLLLPDHVQIKISDNGTGIPEAHLNKIFDPFFTTKDVGEGTGLGLSIVNNIIKAHNGTINLHSVTGEGTEFVIALPLVQPPMPGENDIINENI